MRTDEIILREMIKDETEAVARYTQAIEDAQNPYLKKILTDIKDEELVHIGELEYALKRLVGIDDSMQKNKGYEETAETLKPLERAKRLIYQYRNNGIV